ncbi:MAG: hypothetical protein M3Y57_10890 [Acidobacteriota bacterium]|nr:hypothetical protein [Acidobacteriota bacterium]
MIRPVSKSRTVQFLNDFQVFKGNCESTMKPFGQPVSAMHEAELMIRDDQEKLAAGKSPLYAIHQRSENKILEIVQTAKKAVSANPFILPKAA